MEDKTVEDNYLVRAQIKKGSYKYPGIHSKTSQSRQHQIQSGSEVDALHQAQLSQTTREGGSETGKGFSTQFTGFDHPSLNTAVRRVSLLPIKPARHQVNLALGHTPDPLGSTQIQRRRIPLEPGAILAVPSLSSPMKPERQDIFLAKQGNDPTLLMPPSSTQSEQPRISRHPISLALPPVPSLSLPMKTEHQDISPAKPGADQTLLIPPSLTQSERPQISRCPIPLPPVSDMSNLTLLSSVPPPGSQISHHKIPLGSGDLPIPTILSSAPGDRPQIPRCRIPLERQAERPVVTIPSLTPPQLHNIPNPSVSLELSSKSGSAVKTLGCTNDDAARTFLQPRKMQQLSTLEEIPEAANLEVDIAGAHVPDSIADQGIKITYKDFIAILNANGHDNMQSQSSLDQFKGEERLPVIENDYHRKLMTDAVAAEEELGIDWPTLKSTDLIIQGHTTPFSNPYDWRGWFARGSKQWLEPLRKAVIESGGWDYEGLLSWEKAQFSDVPAKLQDWIYNKSEQDWDSAHRGWIYVQLKDILMRPTEKDEMFVKYTEIFWPSDWSNASPYNCFWLRFPECSPLMPWRSYKSMTMIQEWYKMNKRKIATCKNKMVAMLSSGTPASQLKKKPNRADTTLMNKILQGSKRPQGYRTYTSTPEFKDRMTLEVAKQVQALREERNDATYSVRSQEQFKLREAYKNEAWRELTEDEKQKWRERAAQEANKDIESMTEDEITLAFHRHIVSHLHQVAEKSKTYMMIYTLMTYEGKQWVTFTEAGQSPMGHSLTKSAWRAQHETFLDAAADMASRRGRHERNDIQFAQFIGDEAVAWADDADLDVDDDGEPTLPDTIIVPPLPFTKSSKCDKRMVAHLRSWFKDCLASIHGITSWKVHDWKRFQQNPERFFENMPKAADGQEMKLRNFAHLDRYELEIWRDHLVDSMSKPPKISSPFTFKMSDGSLPTLTKMRHEESTQNVPASRGHRRGRRRIASDAANTKSMKASKMQKSKEIVDSEDTGESSTSEFDEEMEGATEGLITPSQQPRPRPRPRRQTANVARAEVAIILDREQSLEPPASLPKPIPFAGQRVLPGSAEQKEKKCLKRDLATSTVPAAITAEPLAGAADRGASKSTLPAMAAESQSHPQSSADLPDVQIVQMPLKVKQDLPASDSRSFVFQALCMGKSHLSLPPNWVVFGYNYHEICKELFLRLNPLHYGSPPLLTEMQDRLPLVFGGIFSHTESTLNPYPPTVLDIYASIYLLRASVVEYRAVFHGSSPTFKPIDSIECNTPVHRAIVTQIMTVSSPLPKLRVLGTDVLNDRTLIDSLLGWSRAVIRTLTTPHVITTADISLDSVLQLIRVIYFCFTIEELPDDLEEIWKRTVNVLAVIAVDRYSKIVLQKITTMLITELANSSPLRLRLAVCLGRLMSAWHNYCNVQIPRALRINKYTLYADHFPSITLPKDEASVLYRPFSTQPWWASNLEQFPLLIEAPRTHLLQEIFGTLPLAASWSDWQFLDKFAALVTGLASSIPYLNDWLGSRTETSQWDPRGITEERADQVLLPKLLELTNLLEAETSNSLKRIEVADREESEDLDSKTDIPTTPDGDHGPLQSANTELDHGLPMVLNGDQVTLQSIKEAKIDASSASDDDQTPSTSNDDPVPMDLEESLSNVDYAEEPQKTDMDGQHIEADDQIASSHSISLAPEREVLCTSMLEVVLHSSTVPDARAIVSKAGAAPEVNEIPSTQEGNTTDGQQRAEAITLNVAEIPTFSQISSQLKVIDNGDAEFSFLIQDESPFLALKNAKETQEGGSHEREVSEKDVMAEDSVLLQPEKDEVKSTEPTAKPSTPSPTSVPESQPSTQQPKPSSSLASSKPTSTSKKTSSRKRKASEEPQVSIEKRPRRAVPLDYKAFNDLGIRRPKTQTK